MKKLLLIGGIISVILPAMAEGPTNPAYYIPDTTKEEGCGADILGDDLTNTNVVMVAQYTPICGAGQYSLVTENDPNGTCTDCSGDGVYCPGMSAKDIVLDSVTGLPDGSQGLAECPTGYTDGAASATSTTIYSCQKKITNTMCSTLANNFKHGTVTSNDMGNGLLVNYRDVSSHCFSSVSCNAGYRKENIYSWVMENPGAITGLSGCSLGNFKDYTMGPSGQEFIPCDNGMEPGTIKLTFDSNDTSRPLDTLTYATVCSDVSSSGMIAANDANYANLTGASTGQYCYMRNVDTPNQPWILMNDMSNSEQCQQYCGMFNGTTTYPFVEREWNSDTTLIVKDSNNDFYGKDIAAIPQVFVPVAQIPAGACYHTDTKEIYNGEGCSCSDCVLNGSKARYLTKPNAESVSNIGSYTYVLSSNMSQMVGGLAMATASDENAKACVANTINITWNGVTLDENDPAKTCTYGGDLIVPSQPAEHPTDPEHYMFLGWTAAPSSTSEP